jgi:hypothetical protein
MALGGLDILELARSMGRKIVVNISIEKGIDNRPISLTDATAVPRVLQ